MEREKVHFDEIVKEVAAAALFEALGTARPKYKGLSEKEFALIFGLSESQFEHFIGKALGNSLSKKLESNMLKHLEDGDSIEFPKAFNLFVHESEVRTNEAGVPTKKISVRTRKALKEKLNRAFQPIQP